MAAYRIRVPHEAENDIRSLPPAVKRDIRLALRKITREPLSGKPLVGDLAGLWSYRARRHRIVYEVVAGEIRIVLVSRRETIYQQALQRHRRG